MARDRPGLSGLALIGVPVAATALLVVFPAVTLIAQSIDAASLGHTATSGAFAETVRFTLLQAALSTALTLTVGLPLAGVLVRRRIRGGRLVLAAVMVPFVLPTVIVGGAYLATFRRLGLDGVPVDLTGSVWGIVAAHVFFNVAVVVRVVGARWAHLDTRPAEAARTLGAGPARTFTSVTLPALRPAVVAAGLITFVFCFTSYGVVRVLGGVQRSTIETEIYRYAILRQDLRTATAMSVLQLLAIAAVLLIGGWHATSFAATSATTTSIQDPRPRPWRSRTERVSGYGVVVLVVAYLTLPLVILVERSLRIGDQWSFAHYRALTDRSDLLPVTAADAVVTSFSIAAVATLVAVVLGAMTAFGAHRGGRWGRAAEIVVAVPLGLSAVTVGLGMLVAFDDDPVDWRGSWLIVPLAHAMVATPLVARTVLPGIRGIGPHVREAAAALGASPALIVRTIDVPIAARALAVGASFAFAVSMGEFGATSFLARRADQLTAPLAIARLLGRPGESGQGQAAAVGVIVMVVTVAAVALGDRIGHQRRSRP